MHYINRWYDVISLDNLVEKVRKKERFQKTTIVITIDDGFKDNYDFAYPILKELDIPATIFLTSGLIGTSKAPWVDELGMALEKTNQKRLFFPELFGNNIINISDTASRLSILHKIYLKLLYLDHNLKLEYLNRLIQYLGNNDGTKCHERMMLNWSEIVEMSENGITFGAHTMTHPTLSKMKTKEAKAEIYLSRKEIEKFIKNKVNHFAIPNGQPGDFTEELRVFCRNENFRSVLTTNFGIVNGNTSPYDLPRVHITGPLFMFAGELAKIVFKKVHRGVHG
nr:polysaccharide deacetylase family protein [Desulfobacula toluolica]